jgi:nucleoside-diphosphate-sugar epimerase
MPKKALITGVTGFTGRHMVKELKLAGYDVYGIAHRQPASVPEGVSGIYVCSLTESLVLDKIVGELQPDIVVHLAAISAVTHHDIDQIYNTNLLGCRHLMEIVAEHSVGLDGVLLASSANVYGNTREGVLDEETPPQPANDYAVAKLAMEHMARLYSDKLPVIIARPFNYTGVGQNLEFLMPKLIDHAKSRQSSLELGNLDVERDFSDVRTVVKCYRRLLETKASHGGTFNVCSGRVHSLRDVVRMVEDLSGMKFDIRVNTSLVRKREVKSLQGNRQKLVSVIGAVDDISLNETLHWMYAA